MSETSREEAIKVMAGIVKDVKFAMLTTTTAEGHLHARPMTTQEKEYDGDLWFIGAKDTEAVTDMKARPQVNVSFSNPGKGTYLSVNGTAELVEDRAKLDELWSAVASAWFEDGEQDPDIRLLKFTLTGAEVWSTTGGLGFLYQIAKANLTSSKPDIGEHYRLSF